MPSVTYTAKREIIAGHTAGNNYDLDFVAMDVARGTKTARSESESLSGIVETLRHRHTVTWQVRTDYFLSASLNAWREFLYSVDGGESFTFDPSGTIAAPGAPAASILDSDSWSEERLGTTDYYSIAFKVRRQ